MTSLPMELYHEIRFPFDPRRALVWKAICRYLQPWVAREAGLLELGAGYGEFSRQIIASPKWALEQNLALVKKFIEYILKWGYAIAYGFGFLAKGQWSKFVMLERFRWWVIEGFINPKGAS